MSDHAKFSPSKMERIIVCPGSMVLEAGIAEKPSKYAAEGSVAHELAQLVLQARLDDKTDYPSHANPKNYIGRVFEQDGFTFTVDEDMARYVQDYVDAIEQITGPLAGRHDDVLVEQRVYHHRYAGCAKEDGFGTSDLIFLDYAAKTIRIRDLKYGMGVRVYAEDNAQGLTYALAVYDHYSMVEDWEAVEISIHQPRLDHLDTWTADIDRLMVHGDELREAVGRVHEAETCDSTTALHEHGFLTPSEKGCKFCKAKATCPALRAEVAKIVGEAVLVSDFDDLTATDMALNRPQDASVEYLGRAMDLVPLVEEWCLAVRAETERRLFAGEEVDSPLGGYGLGEGRRGARAWTDPAAVEAKLKGARLKHEEMFDYSLISATTAEKRLKKDKPRVWAALQEFIAQKAGKPSVQLKSRITKPVQVAVGADDFDLLADLPHSGQDTIHPFRS